jgi:hypothetical protein
MSYASLAFEGLVCVLLLAAAVMCWRVDRRLRSLRDGQDGLKDTIGQLNDAVDRARASLSALDRASREQGVALKAEVDAGRRLADELRFLTDEGEARAQRVSHRRRGPDLEPSSRDGEPAPARSRLDALKALR